MTVSEGSKIDSPDGEYISHPLLVDGIIENRAYQRELVTGSRGENTLVCLPTGLGKTSVSLLLTAERLYEHRGKSLLLAPTKPLISQHVRFYREALDIPDKNIVKFSGDVRPEKRSDLWDDASVVIATPQVIENDLIGARIDISDVVHLTFDECHRATGDYAYNYIAEQYAQSGGTNSLVTGMSASPGGNREDIIEVCENLYINNVEVRTEDHPSVQEYSYDTEVSWEEIELTDRIIAIRNAFLDVMEDRLGELRSLDITKATSPSISQGQIRSMKGDAAELLENGAKKRGGAAMSYIAELQKLKRAVKLIETQGIDATERYLDRIKESAKSSNSSMADERMMEDEDVRRAMRLIQKTEDDHPKMLFVLTEIKTEIGINGGDRVIVFTESRDTVETLVDYINSFDMGARAKRFVGQSESGGRTGMTQKEQEERLEEFRAGEFEILVSTSVAEEGLDVPEVDLVLFYEPVPEAVRTVQRKGRTGRQREGRVKIAVATDPTGEQQTSDKRFYWIVKQTQDTMGEELQALKEAEGDIIESTESEQTASATVQSDETAADGGAEDADDGGQIKLSDISTEGGSESQQEGSGDGAEDDDTDIDAIEADGDEGTTVVVDQRELKSTVAREISQEEDIGVELETLEVGDYILSDRVAVERKEVDDFLDSLVGGDRSIFEQVGELVNAYDRPVVVIEGENLRGRRNIHPSAINGALASLVGDFGVSILQTEDASETANLLGSIAEREQKEEDREVSVHGEKMSKTVDEQQEYIVASIADIGPVTARTLLEEFRTVRSVMNATVDDLMQVEGVGETTAEKINDIVTVEYDG